MKKRKQKLRAEIARLRVVEKEEKKRQKEELQKLKKPSLQAKLLLLAQTHEKKTPAQRKQAKISISIDFSILGEDSGADAEQARSPTKSGRVPRTPARFQL